MRPSESCASASFGFWVNTTTSQWPAAGALGTLRVGASWASSAIDGKRLSNTAIS